MPSSPPAATGASMAPRRILHCDMDCFYAAVHMRDEPELTGRPVVVGGRPEGRGVVAAASYEARRFGIHSAMPAAQAQRLCADLVFIRPDFARYREESSAIFDILRRFTPLIQPASLDEAYLDVTDHLGDFGSATAVAQEIKRLVHTERRLTVSVGVAPNRLLAKIASDHDKPDGLTVVKPHQVERFLAPLPVRALHGVGPATEKELKKLGAATIAELRAIDRRRLVERFGRHGDHLYRFARGIDDRPVRIHVERKSLSSETTFGEDLTTPAEILPQVERLAASVARGLRKRGLVARTFTIKVRYSDFSTVTRSLTLQLPANEEEALVHWAKMLLDRTEVGRRPVRLLGVGASNLEDVGAVQLRLFDAW